MSVSLIVKIKPTTSLPIKLIGLLVGALYLVGCTGRTSQETQKRTSLSYAKQFEVSDNSLTVLEAWPGATPKQYYIPKEIPKRIICTSTTHLHVLELLGLEDRLVGFANVKYISSSRIRERVANGQITDVGGDGNLNLELIIGLQPDLVIAFDALGNADNLKRIADTGIPVMLNADYMESTALGRAEWIKFFGVLLDKEALADSIFNGIEQDYLSLLRLTKQVADRPNILSGNVYGDTWFLPGGQNNAAKLFEDAGGKYSWEGDSTTSWLELSFESVFNKARDAEFWIGTGSFTSLEEIETQDTRYSDFEAFQNGKVFNYNKRQVPNGGNDFFESGYMRPDLVLADLIHIIHPELIPNHTLYYYQRLP